MIMTDDCQLSTVLHVANGIFWDGLLEIL